MAASTAERAPFVAQRGDSSQSRVIRRRSQMLKMMFAVLALALAGTASAAGWRSLRVDGSSEEAFAQSLEVFKDKLSPARAYAYEEVVKLTDPTDDLAQMRYRAAKERAFSASRSAPQWDSVPNSSPW